MSEQIISMFYPKGDSYIQIMVKTKYKLDLRDLGWCESPSEFNRVSIVVATPPTSSDFEPAIPKVEASQCKDEMAAIVWAAVGVKLDKRGELETVREKALSALRGD